MKAKLMAYKKYCIGCCIVTIIISLIGMYVMVSDEVRPDDNKC